MDRETVTYNQTYGVQSGYYKGKPRWYSTMNSVKTSLHFARKPFALKKAEELVKSCHKPFVDLCRDSDVSIFAARRDTIPADDNGGLFESLVD